MADLGNLAVRDLPPKTHNNPPSEIELLELDLTARHVSLIRAAEDEISFAEKIPEIFTEQSEADYISDYIKKVDQIFKSLESTREEEKNPFLRKGQFVDGFFNNLKNNLKIAKDIANKPLGDFLKKKANAERAEREREADLLEQERLAAFKAVQQMPAGSQGAEETQKAVDHLITMQSVVAVAEKVAAAPITSLSSAAGKYSKAGLVEKWVGVITDKQELDLTELRPYLTEKVLQDAVDKFVKNGGRKLLGAKIEKTMEAKVK